jgi:hypothetical protein
MALHEGATDRSFQPTHVLAHCGLAQMQRVGRPLEAATVRNCGEATERGDVESPMHDTILVVFLVCT